MSCLLAEQMRVEHREERWAASRAEPLAEGEAQMLGMGLSSALGRAQGLGAGGRKSHDCV